MYFSSFNMTNKYNDVVTSKEMIYNFQYKHIYEHQGNPITTLEDCMHFIGTLLCLIVLLPEKAHEWDEWLKFMGLVEY